MTWLHPRKLSERGWLYRPRELAGVRKFLAQVIADEEIELGELAMKPPRDSYVAHGVACRLRRIEILRAALHELPDMALRKRDEIA